MKVVVNAGPLIALGKLGYVHLLHRGYDSVLVPNAVYQEVVTRGLEIGQPDAWAVQLAVFHHDLLVIPVDLPTGPAIGREASLHLGERTAIQLAQQQAADWVLLDDQLARE